MRVLPIGLACPAFIISACRAAPSSSAQPPFATPAPNSVQAHADTSHEHSPAPPEQASAAWRVVLVPSELVVGPNRFAVGLFDSDGHMVHDAAVRLRYFDLQQPESPSLESEAEAVRLETPDGLTTIFAHERDFDRPGDWGVKVLAALPDGTTAIQRIRFTVLEDSPSAAPGDLAPSIHTPTLADASQDLSKLTPAATPNPELYPPGSLCTESCGHGIALIGRWSLVIGQFVNWSTGQLVFVHRSSVFRHRSSVFGHRSSFVVRPSSFVVRRSTVFSRKRSMASRLPPLLPRLRRAWRARWPAREELEFQKAVLEAEDEASPDGILLVSAEGRMLSFNRRFVEMWRLPDDVVASRSDEAALRAVEDQLANPQEFLARVAYLYDHPDETSREEIALRDGRVFDRYSAPVRGRGGARYGRVWFFRDISRRKHAEALRDAEHAVTRLLAASAPLAETVPAILQVTGETLGWELGELWLQDGDGSRLTRAERWHRDGLDLAEFESEIEQIRVVPGLGLTGRVWASGSPAWVPDILQDSNFLRAPQAARAGLHAALSFPIRGSHSRLGVITFFSRSIRSPDADLLAMLESLGIQIGLFVERKQAERALREAHADLETRVKRRTVQLSTTIARLEAEIADRRRTEALLQGSEARFRELLESAPEAMVIVDRDGRIQLVNVQTEQLFGYGREELIGQPVEMLLPAPLRGVHAAHRAEYSAHPDARPMGVGMELAGQRKDGSDFPVEISLSPVNTEAGVLVAAVVRDIRKRKQIEEARLQLEREHAARAEAEAGRQRMAFLAEAGTALAASLDLETTLATVCRLTVPAFADWCAVDMLDEAGDLSRPALHHADPAMRQWARELQQRFRERADAPFGPAHVVRTAQPELYPDIPDELLERVAQDDEHLRLLRGLGMRSAMVVPMIARGRVIGAISLVSSGPGRRFDATDLALAGELAHRAALAVDNSRLYREAQEAIRLREQFLSVASHELRTPVTVVKGYTDWLIHSFRRAADEGRDGPPAWADARLMTTLHKIAESSGKLAMLVEALLDSSRLQSGGLNITPERMNLSALVVSVLEGIRLRQDLGQYSARIALHVQLPEAGPVWGTWDRGRLEQVVVNLMDNALKYSALDGLVAVSLAVEPAGDSPAETQTHLIVRDRGIGVPPEEQARIFLPFSRASNASARNFPGLGLGLAIAREIVEIHAGRIWLESEGLGQGTTVHVVLAGGEIVADLDLGSKAVAARLAQESGQPSPIGSPG